MSEGTPRAVLENFGLRPKREFGQNFLADRHMAGQIAALAALPSATVVELGAGLGALTRPLLDRGAHVVAVERDRDLVPAFCELFAAELAGGVLEIVEADAKGVDVATLCAGRPRPHVLAGNLPYQLTGPLLRLSVEQASHVDRVVFLVQLEVAQRLAAAPGGEDYGGLTVFVARVFNVELALRVRRGAFYPQPNVDSAVVVLTPKPGTTPESPVFRALVHGAFHQRRKKLVNAWKGVGGLTGEQLAQAAAQAQVDLNARGETLSVADFLRMELAVSALLP